MSDASPGSERFADVQTHTQGGLPAPRARRARTASHAGTNYEAKVIPWFLGDSMLAYCPHSKAEMTVAGTLSPSDRVWVTVMPAGSHERDMGEAVRGHSAALAKAIPFTAWKRLHFTVEWVGRSTKSNQHTRRTRAASSTPSQCDPAAANTTPRRLLTAGARPCVTVVGVAAGCRRMVLAHDGVRSHVLHWKG